MKINKKQEKEVLQIYDKWLHSYLNGDVKTYDFYLDDDYRFIGSTNNEEFLNKEDTTKFLAKTADQLAGKTDIRNNVRTIDSLDGIVFITDLFDAYFLIGKNWTYYGRFRFTSALSKKKAGWRFIYQHFSMPDSKAQEGETLGAEQISKENQELRDAIKRRTVELEQKNRDLEIEAGLERVRSRAMAMQNSDELSQLLDTLLQELTKLDFSLTACIINIIDGDDKSNTVWVTNPETGKNPESYYLKFEDYKFHHGMWKAWKARKNSWVYTIEGAEKETYQDYLFNETEFKRFSKKAKEEFMALEKWVASFTFSNFGGLQTIGEERLSKSNLDILARFGKVFDLTYTRFNDLRLAEEQAREAQIELALERVRARTMAMQHSDELADVATVLFQQVKELGIPQWTCGFNIWETGDKEFTFYPGGPDGEILPSCKVSLTEHPIFRQFDESKKRGDDLFVYEKKGEVQADHYQYMHSLPGIGDMLQGMLDQGLEFPSFQIDHLANFAYGNMIFITYEPFPGMHDVFKRFAKVFEQTYTRFIDLQKAEKQAREVEIELALERVRAKTMAMQHSDELQEVIKSVYDRLVELEIEIHSCTIITRSKNPKELLLWFASSAQQYFRPFHMPYIDNQIIKGIWNGLNNTREIFSTTYPFKEKNEFFNFLFKHTDFKNISKSRKQLVLEAKSYSVSNTFMKHAGIQLLRYSDKRFSNQENEILIRFGKVFEQTYIRFLDLQKAEEQAKEAQIETSLERVRAASMAMHHSADLQSVISIVVEQFEKLDIPVHAAFIYDQMEDTKAAHFWAAAKGETYLKQTHVPRIKHPFFDKFYTAIKNGISFYTLNLTKAEKNQMFHHYFTKSSHLDVPLERQEFILSSPGLVNSTVLFDNTALAVQRYNKDVFTDEENEVIKRIGFVFEQAYTRFLDLEKAEAQARESEIELALERVRARTMAMQKSEELAETSELLFQQIKELGIQLWSCGFSLWHENDTYFIGYNPGPTGKIGPPLTIPLTEDVFFKTIRKAKRKGEDFFVFESAGKSLIETYRYMYSLPVVGDAMHNIVKSGYELPKYQVTHCGFFPQGHLMFITLEPQPEAWDIFKRFTKVFEQTYTRFLDLQKAEIQAREAKIEAALEKVRSRTMAMQHSDELPDAANNLFLQVQGLGIPAWSAGYCIWEDNQKSAWCNMSSEGEIQKGFSLPAVGSGYNFYKPLKNNEDFYVAELGGKKLIKHYDFMKRLPIVGEILEEFDKKGIALPTFQIFHVVYFKHGYLLFITYESVPNAWGIFKRFGKVFDQTYTRFLDLQKAEEQTRTAQINLAVERVRAKALAMHKSEEIMEVVAKLKEEVMHLDIPDVIAATIFLNEGDSRVRMWDLSSLEKTDGVYQIPTDIIFKFKKTDPHLYMKRVWENQANYFVEIQDKKGFKRLLAFIREHDKDEIAKEMEEFIEEKQLKRLYHAAKKLNNGKLCIDLLNPPSEEMETILTKMGAAFDLAYKRFEDLQKAENQAREAQIETALERVRSRSMAMHKSEELLEVIGVISEQIIQLDLRFDNISFGTNNQKGDFKFWLASPGQAQPILVEMPFIDNPASVRVLEAQKKGIKFFVDILTRKETKQWVSHLLKNTAIKHFPKKVKDYILNSPGFARSAFILNSINLYVGNYQARPFTNSENKIFNRFAQVFEQSYTRFLDLQKAENQAKEAQIEAALERVRSKTMAMHNSQDVKDAVKTLFEEILKQNDDTSIRCGIGILSKSEEMELWTASFDKNNKVGIDYGSLNMNLHPLLIGLKKTWKAKKERFFYKLKGKELVSYFDALNNAKAYTFKTDIASLSNEVYHNSFIFSEGVLFAFTSKPIPEYTMQVLKRFTAVFEQTYTRFLDLQKAEAQVREAQIEASLERVRSKAMAMHNSKDLVTTANQLFQEFQYLEISFIRCGVIKINEDKTAEIYSYSHTKNNKAVAVFGNFILTGHEFLEEVFKHWKLQKEVEYEMKGDAVKRYYKLINKQVSIPKLQLEKSHFGYGFYFPEGALYCITNKKLSEDTLRILRKFNTVMGLTYRRYFELHKAEARELAAIKESSLDRVRAEIASMQTADDLNRITPLVWKELNTLGVPFFRCGVFIIDQEIKKVHAYLSTPSGESLAALELEFDSMPLVIGAVGYWQKQKVYIEKWNKEQFIEFIQPLLEQGQINSSKKYQGGLEAPEQLVLQMVPFKQGMLYVGSEDSLTNNQIATVESLAKAFSVAYTRYEDFKELEAAKSKAEETLSELKSTQTQLIQSEKMASLGELTAGIAHEIQNPLNFVNNFSELSEEMLEELEEEIKDNSHKIVTEIMTDLKQNLNKITNHGKRASNIVKGMLDHSRTGSGISELSDINKLADEYLRLSYHGLRAKDKTFNADFKTDFDTSLPKIKVVSQDLGRVILNLINNAFYACTERSRSTSERSRSTSDKDYKPKVTVSTKKIGNTIEVRVKDNGSGIPEDIKEKIFQPFFTTKPTGSGTGLGLSLAYDIITKGHNGELKVESKKGEGSEFIIVLPIKK